MTLQECIARYESAHAERLGLTPKGAAELDARRFTRAVADLDATDRAYILGLLKLELVELPATA